MRLLSKEEKKHEKKEKPKKADDKLIEEEKLEVGRVRLRQCGINGGQWYLFGICVLRMYMWLNYTKFSKIIK